MNHLDMRTVLLGYVLSSSIYAALMTSLCLANRRGATGLGFRPADFVNGSAAVIPPAAADSWGAEELGAAEWRGLGCSTGAIPRTAPPQPSSKSSRLFDITEQRSTEVALALQSGEPERSNAESMSDYTGQ